MLRVANVRSAEDIEAVRGAPEDVYIPASAMSRPPGYPKSAAWK